MADIDPNLLGAGTHGLAGTLGAAVLVLWQRLTKKEDDSGAKLDSLVSAVGELKTDLRLLVQDLGISKGQVLEVQARIQGLSENYGSRIGRLEDRLTRVEVRAELREGHHE
jgi:hypothetical protein